MSGNEGPSTQGASPEGMNAYLAAHPRLHPEFFPSYAPELNPTEGVWGYLKHNPLANAPALQLNEITRTTRQYARSVQRKQPLLRAFLKHAKLALRLR